MNERTFDGLLVKRNTDEQTDCIPCSIELQIQKQNANGEKWDWTKKIMKKRWIIVRRDDRNLWIYFADWF